MKIATWNVLHKIHADNWGEVQSPLTEPNRSAAIATKAAELCTLCHAVCLQEVSGDQLKALRAPYVFELTYPRIPTPRRGSTPLADRREHLVVLSSLPASVIAAKAFASDPGKGYLAVRLQSGIAIVSVHATHGNKGLAQLQEVAELCRSFEHPALVGGDFNADHASVAAAFGEGFVLGTAKEGALPTRPRAASEKPQNIDHLIAWRTRLTPVQVFDAHGLSDHNIVCGESLA